MAVRFLIADDYLAHQRLMANIVVFLGGVMRGAANGREAMRLAQSEEFDIILMDLHMPELGGVAAADRLIHGWSGHPHRPRIVAVTGENTPERRALCRAVGMDGFIAKPAESSALRSALQKVIVSGHCWPDGGSERALDMKQFFQAAETSDVEAWAEAMSGVLRDLAGALEQGGPRDNAALLRKIGDEARSRGFVKLERRIALALEEGVIPADWLRGAQGDLSQCLAASREARTLSIEKALAAA